MSAELRSVLRRVLGEYVDLLNALPADDNTGLQVAEACACIEQLADESPSGSEPMTPEECIALLEREVAAAQNKIEELNGFINSEFFKRVTYKQENERLRAEVAHLRKTCADFGVVPARVPDDVSGEPK